MKRIIITFTLALTACNGTQGAVDDATFVCKDGVEYFVYERIDSAGHVASNVVPHFHIDGTLYPCRKETK